MSEPSNMHKVTLVFFCPKCYWGSVHNAWDEATKDQVGADAESIEKVYRRGAMGHFFWICPTCRKKVLGSEITCIDGAVQSKKHIDPLIQDLVKALQELVNWQNGPPLPTPEYEHGWHQAMHLAAVALARAKERGYEYGG